MNKLRYRISLAIVLSVLLFNSCGKEFLDKPVQGALNDQLVSNKAGVDALLIGAYGALDASMQDNQNFSGTNAWEAAPDNWVYGSVAGGDAHKGSNGADQPAIDAIAKFISDPSNGYFNSKWRAVYEGVSRANSVLFFLKKATDVSADDAKNIEAQARFLRGHFYFELKKMFNNVPWIDETTTDLNQPNTMEIWPKIEQDFQYAYENLPVTQPQTGRVNKWAAGAYLGKTYLYQKKYTEAKAVFDPVIQTGQTSNGLKYGLVVNFSDNFNPAVENREESVFAIQQVANDGSNMLGNSNNGDMLNFPYNSPFRCCGFYQPSQDLVNSYRTDPTTGLPLLDTYNTNPVKNDMGISSKQPGFVPDAGSLDPRLDWTVGRRGLPYLDWGPHPGESWVRDQSYGGPYAPKKNVYWQATQDKYADQHSWAPGTAINIMVIRFADVLLMAAEVEAQLSNLEQAEIYVNRVRARAANPASLVYQYKNPTKPTDGFSTTPAANYKVEQYPAGTFASKDKALQAIYFERKLELAMEGHRFFDLVRWGIAESTLNTYISYESKITGDLQGGKFTTGQDEYYPIPQRQIDLQKVGGQSVLMQNNGYK